MQSTIDTERLRLVTLAAHDIDALLGGSSELRGIVIPSAWLRNNPDERAMLLYFAGRIRSSPELAPWRLRLMVCRADATMIGHVGFHDPPTDGRLELGYTVLEPHRRRGYASEAVTALMSAAASDHDVHRFRLAISPDNQPSLAMARNLGFDHVGDQIDEVDGLELLFERSWP